MLFQYARQQEIIEGVLLLLSEVLEEPISITINMEYLSAFTQSLSDSLRANSHDAVLDYLTW